VIKSGVGKPTQLFVIGMVALAIFCTGVLVVFLSRINAETVDQLIEREYAKQAEALAMQAKVQLESVSQAANISAAMMPGQLSYLSDKAWQNSAQSLRSRVKPGEILHMSAFRVETLETQRLNSGRSRSANQATKMALGKALGRIDSSETQFSVDARGSQNVDRKFKLTLLHSSVFNSDTQETFPGNSIAADADYSTVLQVRDSGQAMMRVARRGKKENAPYVDLYIPLFRTASVWSAQDRAKHFSGVLLVGMNVQKVLSDLQQGTPALLLQAAVNDQLLYKRVSVSDQTLKANLGPQKTLNAAVLAQDWRFEIQTYPEPALARLSSVPTLSAIIAGLCCLAVLVFTAVGRLKNKRLEQDRQAQTASLSRKLAATRRSNADLESFAYIVSHDLRTPLRGLCTLSELLLEEVEDLKNAPAKPKGVICDSDNLSENDSRSGKFIEEYVVRMQAQLERMDALVDGIHEYSTLGLGNEETEKVDTRKSILDIATSLSVNDSRFTMQGDFPVLQTYRVRFEQTMANLVGNAFKYHDDPAQANVCVCVSSYGDFYSFSVADDGQGIEPANQEKIFDVFESFRDDTTEGSGVGLSIVKKSVESLGGVVSVESNLGVGTTFKFLWPRAASPIPASGLDAKK